MSSQAPCILVSQYPSEFPNGRNLVVGNGLIMNDNGRESELEIALNGNSKNLNDLVTRGLIWANGGINNNTYVTKTFSSSDSIKYKDKDNVITVEIQDSSSVQNIDVLSNGNGSGLSSRSTLNFIPGDGIDLSITDDGNRINIEIMSETSAGGSLSNAKYIVQTADVSLKNAQSLGALAPGLLKNTTDGVTGTLSKAIPGVDYMAPNSIADVTPTEGRLLMGDGTKWVALDIGPANTYLKSSGRLPYWGVGAPVSGGGEFTVLGSAVADVTIEQNGAYISTNTSLVTFKLPTSGIAAGSTFRIAGFGTGGWKLNQNANQSIYFGNQNTTVGDGGYLASTVRTDCVEIVCVVANTTFLVVSPMGNVAIV